MRLNPHLLGPLNPNKMLMFKNMNKVFNEISLRCKQLFVQNNLIISDCPYKCLGNASFSKKIPHPFSNGVDDQN
jgi:hypothetical protein